MSEHGCRDGIHVFVSRSKCACAQQLNPRRLAESRPGMATVYGDTGEYLGCIGVETWAKLLAGSLVVPPEVVQQIKTLRDEARRTRNRYRAVNAHDRADVWACRATALDEVLSLLGVKDDER